MTQDRRFDVDPVKLAALAESYAASRVALGVFGPPRPAPDRLIDLVDVIEAANRAQAWPLPGRHGLAEARLALLRLCVPVLCETREAVAALEKAMRDLPGAFQPPYPEPLTDLPRLRGPVALRRRLLGWGMLALALPAILALALEIGLAGDPFRACPPAPSGGQVVKPDANPLRIPDTRVNRLLDRVLACPGPVVEPGPDVVALPLPSREADATPGRLPSVPAPVTKGPPTVLDRIFTPLALASHEMTPLQLAERLSGSGRQGIAPGIYLRAMLDRYPLPPESPIPRSETGALALLNWAVAISTLEGDPAPIEAALGAFAAQAPTAGRQTVPGGVAGLREMLTAADARFDHLLRDRLYEQVLGEADGEGLSEEELFAAYGISFPDAMPPAERYAELSSALSAPLSGTQHTPRSPGRWPSMPCRSCPWPWPWPGSHLVFGVWMRGWPGPCPG